MTFPIINFKSTNTETDPKLQDLVTRKLSALEKFIQDESDVKCDVEFEKVAPKQSGDVYRIEINLWLRGELYRAEATRDAFEKAIDEARNEVEKELRRTSEKKDTLIKRGGRAIKEKLQSGT